MKPFSILGWILGALAFLYVVFFFSSIWPLAGVDLGKPKLRFEDRARELLDSEKIDHAGYTAFVRLATRSQVLDTLQGEQGRDAVVGLSEKPNGLVRYYIQFKKTGSPRRISVVLHPSGDFIGYIIEDDPDLPKGGYTEAEFREIAQVELQRHYEIDSNALEESGFDSETKDGVVHRQVEVRRPFAGSPSLDEVFVVASGGKEIITVGRRVQLTPNAALEQKRASGAEKATSQFGFLCLGAGLIAGYILFLFQLRNGKVELGPALKVSAVLFAMVLCSSLLDSNSRFEAWDPVLPAASKWFKLVGEQFLIASWALILGWVFLAAGSAAPGGGPEKTALFWRWLSFEWSRGDVALATLRGAAIGFVCGAVTILMVKFFESACGGMVGLQPRAFYLSILDRQFPALAILIFFFPVAVVEEAGYRLFGGLWTRKLTGSKFLAILLPAIVFGLTHTSLGFLPPEKPWWGRALIMTMIGLIWGWAFFRFDFLTVVISHFMADVVIFSWPLLVSEYLPTQLTAALGMTVPLWPLLFVAWRWIFRKNHLRSPIRDASVESQ